MLEETTYGTRRYISPELLQTVKLGETWSLDYGARCYKFDPADTIVEFAGRTEQGWYRWKHSTGRVFTYTQEQCCRLIYVLIPKPAPMPV